MSFLVTQGYLSNVVVTQGYTTSGGVQPILYSQDVVSALQGWWLNQTSLQSLTSDGKLHHLQAPESTLLPYATYFKVSEVVEQWTTAYGQRRSTVQFNLHAQTDVQAQIIADQMAAACAVACRASALIFLTDVAGDKGADCAVIRWLSLGQVNELVASAIVSGGMLPKLEACRHALNRGVGRVRIFPASEAEALAQFYFEKSAAGTEVRVA